MSILARLERIREDYRPELMKSLKDVYYREIKRLERNLKDSEKLYFKHYGLYSIKDHVEIISNIIRTLTNYHFSLVYFISKDEKATHDIKKYVDLKNHFLENTKVVLNKSLHVYLWSSIDEKDHFKVNNYWVKDHGRFKQFNKELNRILMELRISHPDYRLEKYDFGHRKQLRIINTLYLKMEKKKGSCTEEERKTILSLIKKKLEEARKKHETESR